MQFLKNLYQDESGDALQYLVVAGVMVLGFFVLWKLIQPGITTQFNKVSTELSQ